MQKVAFLQSGHTFPVNKRSFHLRRPNADPAGDSDTSSMLIAQIFSTYLGLETMLHMTCLGSKPEMILEYLEKAKTLGLWFSVRLWLLFLIFHFIILRFKKHTCLGR